MTCRCALLFSTLMLIPASLVTAEPDAANAPLGRWGITIHDSENGTPSWLEVAAQDNGYKLRFCGPVAGVTDLNEFKIQDNAITFKSGNYDRGKQAEKWTWTGTFDHDTMKGTRVDDDGGNKVEWSARLTVLQVNVAGTWQLSFEKELANKAKMGTLTLRQDDSKLTGTIAFEGQEAIKVEDACLKNGELIFGLALSVPSGGGGTYAERYTFKAKVKGDVLEGTVASVFGQSCGFTGQRERKWGKPIELFNGKNLEGWKPLGKDKEFRWTVEDGVMMTTGGANIVSERKFKDFKIHVEFRVPEHGNSGVYLRGRYEIQVADSFGQEPGSSQCGGLYSRITPTKNASKPAGEWQTFDATLIGQYLTLLHNGEKIIDNQELEGITGGAIDSHESDPGPIYLQGDHGKIEYRQIIVTPAQ